MWLIAKLDPIKFIFEKPSLSGRIARWQVLLSEFDILYVSHKSIKGSAIADSLIERANNVTEYEACVLGLQVAIEKKIKSLTVYGDSALVICQLNGEWKTRDSKLMSYQEFIKGLIEQFEEITFKHLPREENYLANALATLATMFKVNANAKTQLVKLEVRESQAHCTCV